MAVFPHKTTTDVHMQDSFYRKLALSVIHLQPPSNISIVLTLHPVIKQQKDIMYSFIYSNSLFALICKHDSRKT